MAKIKVNTTDDSTLIKFDAVQHGEVFIDDCEPFIKCADAAAFKLTSGSLMTFEEDDLVTYVKRAELKLTI